MTSQIPIAVNGALGRMGQTLISIIKQEDKKFKLVGAVERKDAQGLGQDIGQLTGQGNLGVNLTADFKSAINKAKVYIDFSSIEASLHNLKIAEQENVAAVIGTTGFSEDDLAQIKKIAENIPVLWSPNMSLGVNLMFKIAAEMAKALPSDFNIEIVEAHHNLKKDAPSGTAVKLHEVVSKARNLGKETMVSGRQGLVGARTQDEIAVLAIRGGDIIGDHTVFYCGPGERLELTHRAHTRATFAQGAIKAAYWLNNKKAGFYSLSDVLNLQ